MLRVTIGLLCMMGTAAVGHLPQGSPPVIGVLEQPQCAEDSALAVRALFVKVRSDWVPLDRSEAAGSVDLHSVNWTATLDGRDIGAIRTVDPGFPQQDAWTYPRDHFLRIPPDQKPPKIPNTRHAFRGWCNEPSLRPIVLVTPGSHADSNSWEPSSLLPSVRDSILPTFRKDVGNVVHCPADPERAVPFQYAESDVLVHAGFRDSQGRTLVALGLDPKLNGCDGPRTEEWWLHWFLIDQEIWALGAGLEFVDAGDYDGDGQGEVLFWYSGYNQDGYTLFYDGFRKHAEFSWRYH